MNACLQLGPGIVFVLTTFLFFSSANSQIISSRLFTGRDGLVSTYVFSSYQDKSGYLWVCTNGGISRYDGQSFTNYGLADGLPDNRVIGAVMDSHNRLWAFTSRGISRFKNNRFINYPLSDSAAIHWVFQVMESSNGRLCALTDLGVYEFDETMWQKIKLYPGYENHACVSLFETNDGTYISYGNIVVLKKKSGGFQVIAPLTKSDNEYGAISLVGSDIFLWTTHCVYKIFNNQLISCTQGLKGFKSNYVYLYDHKQRLWTAESGVGIKQMMGGVLSPSAIVYKGPPEFLIQSMMEDQQGNVWASTGKGLLRLSEEGVEVFNTSNLFGSRVIRNIIETRSGSLIVNDGTLALHALSNGIFNKQPLLLKTSVPPLNKELIVDDYDRDENGENWLLTRDLFVLKQVGNVLIDQRSHLSGIKGDVLALCFDNYRKQMTIAAFGQTYPCFFDGKRFRPFEPKNAAPVFGYITHLHSCRNGKFLFSTSNGRIYAIDTAGNCQLLLNEFDGKAITKKLIDDPLGGLWIIYSGRGLRHYEWKDDRILFDQNIGKAQGLDNDAVNDACFDNNNNLWIATNSGAAVFSRTTNNTLRPQYRMLRSFSATDLGIGDEIETHLQKDECGNIWLFSERHLIRFYTNEVKPIKINPPVQIEKIDLNLQATNWANYTDSVTGLFGLPVHLTLSHENSSLGFYFKGINIDGTDGMEYSYRLDGFSKQWSTSSPNHFVSFIGLPPGRYSFSVKAQLNNNGWGPPATFVFQIKKAYWQTWWFYTLIVLLASVAVYLLFRFRLLQKTKLMDMRNRFSRDLHDEIGSSISGINLLSQVALDKMQNHQAEEAEDYLIKVTNYTGDMVEKLSDMVWIFQPQNDSLQKLIQRLQSFAQALAIPKEIKIQFEIDKECETINLSIQQRKALYLISKEAINNAVKYSNCKLIQYQFTSQNGSCLLTIKDDGQGFIPEERKAGNGLENMRSRAEEVAARLAIHSSPGKGTAINLQL